MKKNKNLTVYDLIIEYMITKIELGYEPSYTMDEFDSFLEFLDGRLEVDGVSLDRKEMLDNFYGKMYERYWCYFDENNKKICVPHIKRVNDNLLVATNRLGKHDIYTTNICKMNRKNRENIKKYMEYFLYGMEKRRINTDVELSYENIELAKLMTAKLIYIIIRNYQINLVHQSLFNIERRILHAGLNDVITNKMLEKEMIDFYRVVYIRIACLLEEDPELIITNKKDICLGYSNYMSIMKDYGKFICLCENNAFEIDTTDDREILDNRSILSTKINENDVKTLKKILDNKSRK